MATSNKKIEQLARALFPRYGIHDVGSLVSTIVQYRQDDGCVRIYRPEGRWSWFKSLGSTVVTPAAVILAFRADYRRTVSMARDDLYRQLEKATLSVMSEEEFEQATKPARRPAKSTRGSIHKSSAEVEREIAAVVTSEGVEL